MKLLDDDGENGAVRWFLAAYGGGCSKTIGAMQAHLKMSGFEGCWPDWCKTAHPSQNLTKGGAQQWLRHLFSLEAQQVAVPDALTGDQIIEWMRQRGLGTLDAENQALCVKLIRAYEENPKIGAKPVAQQVAVTAWKAEQIDDFEIRVTSPEGESWRLRSADRNDIFNNFIWRWAQSMMTAQGAKP